MKTESRNPASKSWIILGSPLLRKEWEWLAARTIFFHGSQERCTQRRRGQANPTPFVTVSIPSPPPLAGSWWEMLGQVELARTLLMRLRGFLSHGSWPGFWGQWLSASSKNLKRINVGTKKVRQPLLLKAHVIKQLYGRAKGEILNKKKVKKRDLPPNALSLALWPKSDTPVFLLYPPGLHVSSFMCPPPITSITIGA